MAAKDVVVIGIVLFMLALAFFVLRFTSTTIVTNMLSVSAINASGNATIQAFQSMNTVTQRSDYLFGVFLFGLFLSMIITAWFIAGNPLFMFIYFLVIVLGVIFSTIFSNIFQTVVAQAIFGTTINSLPLINNVMNYLPYYVAITGFIGLVIMFGKPQWGGGYA